MNNENIKTNATVSENVENDLLTEKTNYGTINSADLISGKAELVLMQPFDDGDSGISVACVGGDSGSSNTGSDNNYDCCDDSGSSSGGSLEKAQYYDALYAGDLEEDYSLLNENCLHYVNELLEYSNNINDEIDVYINTNERDSPKAYYDDLIEIIAS